MNDFISIDKASMAIKFHPRAWHDEDIFLAKCMWMDIDSTTGAITADMKLMLPRALYEFIESCYPALWNQPAYESMRLHIGAQLKDVYSSYYDGLLNKFSTRAPWIESMFNHQRNTVCAMDTRRATLLAFEQGLGKTITTATVSVVQNVPRTVVVTPDVGKWNWVLDLSSRKSRPWHGHKFFDYNNFSVLNSEKRKNMYGFTEKFVIINYEAMHKYMEYLEEYSGLRTAHIVFDECQNIKNIHSKRYKYCEELVDRLPESRITMLSGTPVTNRANDMFAYFRMIKHPLGESYSAFMNMYTNTKMGRVTGSKNMTLLHKRMSNFMIRKTEKECLDLPGISYTRMFFEIGDYKNDYEQAIKDAIANKKGKKLNVDGSIHSINNIMAQAKVPGLIKQIDEMIETSGKVVVFFTYSKPIAMMAEYYGDKCVVVDGSIDGEEKIARAEKFQNDPSINVFIGNMKAAGHTIDLTSAKVCVIGNFPLSPADILQAIRRLYRIGQKDAVKVYFALCIGDRNETTVDIRLADLIEDKIEDINMIVDGGQDVIDITNVTDVLASEFLNVKDNDNAEEGSQEPDSQNP